MQRVVLAVFVLSLGISCTLALAGMRPGAAYAITPAAFVSAWAFAGHLVTLDDDAPGGWANPRQQASVWRESLVWLAAKLVALLAIGGATAWLWS